MITIMVDKSEASLDHILMRPTVRTRNFPFRVMNGGPKDRMELHSVEKQQKITEAVVEMAITAEGEKNLETVEPFAKNLIALSAN